MKFSRLLVAGLSLVTVLAAADTPLRFDPDNGGLRLPPGFRALIVADNLMKDRPNQDALRFLAVGPNGVLYAKTQKGGILALSDTQGTGRFDKVEEFGSGGGTGIAVHDGWLYSSTDQNVFRYRLSPGVAVPSGPPERIVRDLSIGAGHNAKSFAFDDQGRLLVEQGSPFNAYSEPDRALGSKGMDPTEFLKTHGGFWRYEANKPDQTQADGYHVSTGHRHVLAIAWQPQARAFFFVQMGRDGLNTVAPQYYDALDNAERVAEEMHRLTDGLNIGWPYTYFDPHKKSRMLAPEFGGDNHKQAEPGKYPDPLMTFPGHWAPLQMLFYSGQQFPEKYHGGAFIAFHGSWNRAPEPQDGYNVSFVPVDATGQPKGVYEPFARRSSGGDFRMGGLAQAADGSLYLSETDLGRIWRVVYVGVSSTDSIDNAGFNTPAALPALAGIASPGRDTYAQICAACHMPDGSGAGQMQPKLQGSTVVGGDLDTLIRVILQGPATVLPADRPKYQNVMPAFTFFSDQQVVDLIAHLRRTFAGKQNVPTDADVARVRAALH